ncbi:MAG: pseudouridine synthase [Anaerolineae bacterium]|nr:pseudouridine synthase [Anaerolineae bacterium]
MPEERLQKVLAHAGVASRRRAEEIIQAGKVRVNGEVVTELGTKVDPDRDVIQVEGRTVRPQAPVYLVLNKPRGVLSAASDARGRTTVVDLVRHHARLYPVGRLDLESEGLVLLTNDGALALRLAHPRYEHEKEYRVLVTGRPDEEALQRLREGIGLEGGRTRPARVSVERQGEEGTWLRIVLREGRKRQIRRMLEAVGYGALRLIRVRMGPLELGRLKPGQYRPLSPAELRAVRDIRREGRSRETGRRLVGRRSRRRG